MLLLLSLKRIFAILVKCGLISALHKAKHRKSSFKRQRRNTWHTGAVPELIKTAEIRDKRAWAEHTFPGARLGSRRQPNYQSRIEIEKLKTIVPIKVLKQKVEQCELRDYRAKAEKLTPKGEYFGMKNFHRSLSVASYFSRGLLYSYPQKEKTPSLYELVAAEDGVTEVVDDVFEETGLTSSRSEKGLSSGKLGRQSRSDSELMSRWQESRRVNPSQSDKMSETYSSLNRNKYKMSKLCAVQIKLPDIECNHFHNKMEVPCIVTAYQFFKM
jgi:hypothetical protein